MSRLQQKLRDERGMTVVMVGVGFLAFMSATMLAIDVGQMMVARTQSQSAADAGALAGAVALAFDNYDDRSAGGPAVQNAIEAARSTSNNVVNAKTSVIASDVTFPAIDKVRVVVQSSAARGNPISMFIAPIIGINTANVGAIATAQVMPANAMTCVKPFTIPDKWVENQTPPWDSTDTFDAFDKKGNPIANPDVYIPKGDPANPNPNYSGYDQKRDTGTLLTLKAGTGNNIEPSFYFAWAIPGSGGASDYRWNIGNCNTTVIGFDFLETAEPGNMVGPTKQGMDDLIARDPSAYWDATNKRVVSDIHPSPRVVAIPVFDPVYYESGKVNGRNADLKAVNYIGFFIDRMVGNDVRGYITPIGGLYKGNGGPTPPGAFPKAIVLVE